MLTLGVDTSSDSGSLALVHDAVVLGQREISAEQYSASLLREAAALLAGCRMSFEEIGLYEVNAGPGSFTGLRVGLTTVKAWAEVWGKPVAAVSGLEAMAKQVSNLAAPGSLIAAVTDARRGQVFGGLFRSTTEDSGALAQAGDEVLGTADEFLESLRPRMADGCELVIACFDPELIRSAIEREAMSGCR